MQHELLETLESWVKAGSSTPFDRTALAELESQAIKALQQGDEEGLSLFRDRLSPLVEPLFTRLQARGFNRADLQAAGLPVLVRLLRAALFLMEKEDPHRLLARNPHGRGVLEALQRAGTELNLLGLGQHWPAGDPPSTSTLSRTVAALEEGGLVLRLGATRGLKVRLLPRGAAWLAQQQEARVAAALAMSRSPQRDAVPQGAGRQPEERAVSRDAGHQPEEQGPVQPNVFRTPQQSALDFRRLLEAA